MVAESHIEQHVWTLLEDLGFDLEEDNNAAELSNKCINNIMNLIKNYEKCTLCGCNKIEILHSCKNCNSEVIK